MAKSFHLFSLLPLELRQRIWVMSMEPRRVRIGDFSNTQYYKPEWASVTPPAPPPTLLHACAESRFHLERHYRKIGAGKPDPQYIWINFDLDTVCIRELFLEDFPIELSLIRHLCIDSIDSENFWWLTNDHLHASSMPLLEDLLIQTQSRGKGWWREWDSKMRMFYYNDSPRPFRTRIVCPFVEDDEVPDLTTDNWIKVDRRHRRKMLREHPEWYAPDFEVSDSEDDLYASGRFHKTNHHSRTDCACPVK
ncbi:hypothetical protein F5X68DRAFT_213280 [Plectosphaerella plurivora]|uniref:2EXR domain-containing protein n=1 Tax=Plectosphaerella plurivora TaxID=936078 RepID=A0A9P8V5S8_9PEZI|nr:hypothetical protein F5X68DRAFT_213280 [Plectosphaerella plurivora]